MDPNKNINYLYRLSYVASHHNEYKNFSESYKHARISIMQMAVSRDITSLIIGEF